MIQSIPLVLVISRGILGPVFLIFAFFLPHPWVFASILIYAFVSDVADGKIARRLQVADSSLRRLDSAADSLFYICVGISVWILYPDLVKNEWALIAALLFLEIFRYLFDAFKFKREASYHMWSAKFWGVVLFVASFCIFVTNYETQFIFRICLIVGIISDLEGIAISIILPKWKHDVPTIWHAFKLRNAS